MNYDQQNLLNYIIIYCSPVEYAYQILTILLEISTLVIKIDSLRINSRKVTVLHNKMFVSLRAVKNLLFIKTV